MIHLIKSFPATTREDPSQRDTAHFMMRRALAAQTAAACVNHPGSREVFVRFCARRRTNQPSVWWRRRSIKLRGIYAWTGLKERHTEGRGGGFGKLIKISGEMTPSITRPNSDSAVLGSVGADSWLAIWSGSVKWSTLHQTTAGGRQEASVCPGEQLCSICRDSVHSAIGANQYGREVIRELKDNAALRPLIPITSSE